MLCLCQCSFSLDSNYHASTYAYAYADVDSQNQDLTSLSVYQTQFIYPDYDIRFIVTFVSGRYLLQKCLCSLYLNVVSPEPCLITSVVEHLSR